MKLILRTILTVAILRLLPAAYAADADLVVTQFADSFDAGCGNVCSLRDAIQAANASGAPTRIVLRTGTYPLTRAPLLDESGFIVDEDDNANGDFDIRGHITIVGQGIDQTIIDANQIDRAFEILPGAAVQITGVTIRNGRHTDHGAGIAVDSGGVLTLRYSAVSHNTTGGGIGNYGALTVEASRFDHNFAQRRYVEGGVDAGGAIYNAGNLTVRETRFIANQARDDEDSGFGGAIQNTGTALILRSSFEDSSIGYYGEGMAISNSGSGTLRMENSTVTGGGFEDEGVVGAVENGSWFTRNVLSTMRLINVTISQNLGHGIFNRGKLEISNSIVAGNGFPEVEEGYNTNCLNYGPLVAYTQHGLLRGTDESTNCEADIVVPNADVFTRVMYPLALNNWVTPTYALRPHSPAVDAAVGACPSTDQRRVTRPRDGDGDGTQRCDVGAYERPKP